MFAVIDCGTTMTRIYIVDENQQIIASGRKKVGVRDTSITGSRDTLRSGVTELFFEVLEENRLSAEESQGYARESLSHAQTSADYAQESQGYAGQSAEYAQQSLGYANESLSCAGQSGSHALISQSWAVGGTGARQGEDTNNAMFWSLQAQAAAGGGVMSFNGRSGTVLPQSGDYTAQMVGADPQGSAQASYRLALLALDRSLLDASAWLARAEEQNYEKFSIELYHRICDLRRRIEG